jgi:hypothetical protein
MIDLETFVIQNAEIPEVIADGAWIEIVSKGPMTPSGSTHTGTWVALVCSLKDGVKHTRAVYVSATGKRLRPREFKTPKGLISFGMELGLRVFCLPLYPGERAVWRFETSILPDDMESVSDPADPAAGQL